VTDRALPPNQPPPSRVGRRRTESNWSPTCRRKSIATGTVHVVANGHHYFSFTMTWAEVIGVQERFFQLMKVKGYDAENYADKVPDFGDAGLPQSGDPYPGPMYAGE
jgi:hypothetical protein